MKDFLLTNEELMYLHKGAVEEYQHGGKIVRYNTNGVMRSYYLHPASSITVNQARVLSQFWNIYFTASKEEAFDFWQEYEDKLDRESKELLKKLQEAQNHAVR